AAVAADVEVPPAVGGDHADVLRLGLGALARAAGDADLDLVGRAQAAVAPLEMHGHRGRVAHAVAAPVGAQARLHHPQRFAVGVPGLEAGRHQALPDLGKLLEAGTEHADPLGAVDLHVQAVILRDLGEDEQLLGSDLTRG